jgi:hypothetical protein
VFHHSIYDWDAMFKANPLGIVNYFWQRGDAVAITANIGAFESEFFASLSEGGCIEAASLRDLAQSLFRVGVEASNVQYRWCAGQRMLTAGQQAAFAAEMRALGRISTPSALDQSEYRPEVEHAFRVE